MKEAVMLQGSNIPDEELATKIEGRGLKASTL